MRRRSLAPWHLSSVLRPPVALPISARAALRYVPARAKRELRAVSYAPGAAAPARMHKTGTHAPDTPRTHAPDTPRTDIGALFPSFVVSRRSRHRFVVLSSSLSSPVSLSVSVSMSDGRTDPCPDGSVAHDSAAPHQMVPVAPTVVQFRALGGPEFLGDTPVPGPLFRLPPSSSSTLFCRRVFVLVVVVSNARGALFGPCSQFLSTYMLSTIWQGRRRQGMIPRWAHFGLYFRRQKNMCCGALGRGFPIASVVCLPTFPIDRTPRHEGRGAADGIPGGGTGGGCDQRAVLVTRIAVGWTRPSFEPSGARRARLHPRARRRPRQLE